MRVLINQKETPPRFVDEGGKVVLNEAGTGFIPSKDDTTKRIYHCQENEMACDTAVDLGPLVSSKDMFINKAFFDPAVDNRTSLDDIDIGDIDLDGDLDMVVANRDGLANYQDFNLVFRNRGSPPSGGKGIFDLFRFTASQDDIDISTHDTALGDFDKDGDLDLLTINDLTWNKLWKNKAQQMKDLGQDPTTIANPAELFQVVDGPAALGFTKNSSHAAFVDLNGDGWLDIHIGGQFDENETLLFNNANPPFITWTVADGPLESYSVAYGDLNNDGRTDMVTVNGGFVHVHRNCRNADGTTTFPEVENVLVPSGGFENALGVAIGDLDNDGDADVVISQGDQGYAPPNFIFRNNLVP